MTDISRDGQDTIKVTVDYYQQRQQNAQHLNEKKLYDYMMYVCNHAWGQTYDLDTNLHTAEEQRGLSKNPVQYLLHYMMDQGKTFSIDTMKDARHVVSQYLIEPQDSAVEYESDELKSVEPNIFFKVAYAYDLGEILENVIKNPKTTLPRHIVNAYPAWKRKNRFTGGNKWTGEPLNIGTILASKDTNHPNEPVLSEYERLSSSTRDEKIARLYQDLAILADPAEAPETAGDRLYSGIKPVFKSFFATITGHYKHLNEEDKRHVRDTLVTYMNPLPMGVDLMASFVAQSEEQRHSMRTNMMAAIVSVVAPQNLFQAIHMYNLADVFNSAITRGQVSETTAKAYNKWKKDSQAFIKKYEVNPVVEAKQIQPDASLDVWKAMETLNEFIKVMSHMGVEGSPYPQYNREFLSEADIDAIQDNPLIALVNKTIECRLALPENPYLAAIAKDTVFEIIPDTIEQLDRHPIVCMSGKVFFEFVKIVGAENELETLLATEKFPFVTFDMYQTWKDTGVAPVTARDAVPEEIALFKQAEVLSVQAPQIADQLADLETGLFKQLNVTTAVDYISNLKANLVISFELTEPLSPHSEKLIDLLVQLDSTVNHTKSKHEEEANQKKLRLIVRNFVLHADAHFDKFNTQEKNAIGVYIETLINPEILNERGQSLEEPLAKIFRARMMNVLKSMNEPFPFFRVVHLLNLQDAFKISEKTGLIPNQMRATYKNWTRINQAFIAETKKRNESQAISATQTEPEIIVEEIVAQEPITVEVIKVAVTDPRVTYIDVTYPLITRGNREEGMGVRAVDEAEQLESDVTSEKVNLGRYEKIKEVLLQDATNGGYPIHITIHRDVRQPTTKTSDPYNIMDVEIGNGTRSRIAVCNYSGNMTFVERDAPEHVKNIPLDLEAMRKNQKVWHVPHMTDSQWIEGIQEILYTPLDKMSPALKSRSYWYSLGEVGVQTLVTKFMIAGRAPPTVDTKNLIDCGPLKDKSKFNLLYAAWNRGGIKGFEKGTTFTIVLKSLTEGEDASMPWLKKFENKPQITAEGILAASERFKREWGFAVEDGFYDALMIDTIDARINGDAPDMRRTGIEADIAFKFHAVAVNDNDVKKWGRYPDSLDDFLALTGIVEEPSSLAVLTPECA